MAKKSNSNDITKTGAQTYRQLQEQNNSGRAATKEDIKKYFGENLENTMQAAHYENKVRAMQLSDYQPMRSSIYNESGGTDRFGNSMFDDDIFVGTLSSINSLSNARAENQPWYAQLGAGLVKGVGLAATTFIDGTVGLITGIGTAIGEGRLSGLWDNAVSNAMHDFNQSMETFLPNYMTDEEKENPWYKNLGTMNFWANNVIKNIGFTVGAFYSGGAWNKALKAVGWLKGATSAKAIGSFTSAVNEGRIEANNAVHDMVELENKKLDDFIQKRAEEIENSSLSEVEKNQAYAQLDSRADELRQDIQDRADGMGLTTLIGNTVLLSLDNLWQFGKLYARGFKEKNGLASGISKAAEKQAMEAAGEGIVKEGEHYIAKETSKTKAILKGVSNGLVEGHEEMAQAFIAETASNWYDYDSPDAYYKALKDPKAQLKTNEFLSSAAKGLANTYGNGNRWEEFAIGMFTGLLGMPTFGRVANSDSSTYLGKGSIIGLSGGLFGEIKTANKRNAEIRENVDFMNKYIDKIKSQANYFAQSQSFTDAMDGWAAEGDKFEYKNAENNEDFAAVSRFARAGKLNDLKEMITQSLSNLSDEQLEDIALNTSPNAEINSEGDIESKDINGEAKKGGWRNVDGSLMSDSEEGRAAMRSELEAKRDKMLSEIDKYEKSVETVRAIGNNSLTEDQVNELAWLDWKIKMFSERYNEIKDSNYDGIQALKNSLSTFISRNEQGLGDLNINGELSEEEENTLSEEEKTKRRKEESESANNILKSVKVAKQFLEALEKSDSPLKFAAMIEANPQILDFLEDWAYPMLEEAAQLSSSAFDQLMTNLKDTARLAKVAKEFNDRYKEFTEDPLKLIQNREKIDKKKERTEKAADDISLKDKVNNASVSEIVEGIDNGDLDAEGLDTLFTDEDNEFLRNHTESKDKEESSAEEGTAPLSGKDKVEEAKKIIKTASRTDSAINELEENEDESLDAQALEDARILLNNSKAVANSEDELLDTSTEAYNDPSVLYNEEDPSLQGLSDEDIQGILEERLDAAKSIIEQIKATLQEENDNLDNLSSETGEVVHSVGEELVTPQTEAPKNTSENAPKETGHDSVTKTETENERRAREEKEKKEKREKKEKADNIIDFFNDAIEELGLSEKEREEYETALFNILNSINMLVDADMPAKEIGKAIKDTSSYKKVKSIVPDIDDYLNVYTTSKMKEHQNRNTENNNLGNTEQAALDASRQSDNETNTEGEDEEGTPEIMVEDMVQASSLQMKEDPNKDELNKDTVGGKYRYWKPSSAYLPFGTLYQKGDTTPFYKIARSVKKPDGTPMFTEAQLQRIEAVGKYLDEHGTFQLVDSGAVKKGDTVHFVIDSTLNEQAGEIIILMADDQGRIIGDVMSPNDYSFDKQIGLRQFVERVLKEYKDAESPQHFTSKETTKVMKNMVGKVPYLSDKSRPKYLNYVYSDGDTPIPFMLGISVGNGKNVRILASPGRTKKQGQSALEESIMYPLKAKKGQPFLLMPTGSSTNPYIPVPFVMAPYSITTKETALGQAIRKVLEKIPLANNENAITIIRSLKELISVKEVHINYNEGNVKVTIKPNGAEHQRTIYNGSVNAENVVDQIEYGLQVQNLPFQISRKYINDTYQGHDYNRMVGEIAAINLPVGGTHTISNWFTLVPLDNSGAPIKGAKPPVTTGKNPNAVRGPKVEVTRGGKKFIVDFDTWDITDVETGKVYTGDHINLNKARAQAVGIQTGQNMDKPYNTDWGYYDPKKDDFVDAPNIITHSVGQELVTSKTNEEQKSERVEITYTPKGKKEQTYYIEGAHIYNKDGKEVFKNDSVDRNKIFANLAVKQGRAKVVEHKGNRYVVNNKGAIISVTSGKIMKWGPENGDRKAILQLAGIEETTKDNTSIPTSTKSEGEIAEEQVTPSGMSFDSIDGVIDQMEVGESNEQRKEKDEEKTTDSDLSENKTTEVKQSEYSPEELEDKANKVGILNNPVRKALWKALSPAQQTTLLSKGKGKQRQLMAVLEAAFNISNNSFNEAVLKGSIDTFLGRKALNRIANSSRKVWNRDKETKWLSKVLPNMSTKDHLRIVGGLIKITDSENPGFAYGQFVNGIITISDKAASGTLYHEAFHAVVHTLLSEKEYNDLFTAAVEKYGNIGNLSLEENLAEDFRRYVQLEETPVIGKMVRVFRTLKHLVQNLLGNEPYINALFYRINRGKLRKRSTTLSNVSRFNTDTESINKEMQSIKEQAIANGTFMKAPNGKPTNLTERQWLQVRTTSFKDWFGDWENSPSEASKVVDENGEPLVVYHGGAQGVNNFNTKRNLYIGKHYGAYFTPSQNFAELYKEMYNGTIYPVFLNIKQIANIEDSRLIDEKQYNELINKNYDGVKGKIIEEYVVFNPNQIKSATDNVGSFSRENDDIRYRRVETLNDAKEILSEEEYSSLIEELDLDRDNVDSFIYNFMSKVINVRPRVRNDYSSGWVENALMGVSRNRDKSIASVARRILGYDVDVRTAEEFENEIKNWRKNLINRLTSSDDKYRIGERHREIQVLSNKINVLQRYLGKRTTNGFNEEELNIIESIPIGSRAKSNFQAVGKAVQKYKKELEIAKENLRRAYYGKYSYELALKNRLVALSIVPNLKDLAIDRVRRQDSSVDRYTEKDKERLVKIRPLYQSMRDAAFEKNNGSEIVKDKVGENLTVDDLSSLISQKIPEAKDLLDILKKANPRIKIVVLDSDVVSSEVVGDVMGMFDTATNTLTLCKNSTEYHCLHELVHACTGYGLIGQTKDGRPLKEAVEEFMEYVKEYISSTGLSTSLVDKPVIFGTTMSVTDVYGFTNADEFVAEVFGNPRFQAFLEQVPPMKNKKYNSLFKEFFSTIIDVLNKLFGRKNKTALDQAKKIVVSAAKIQEKHLDYIYDEVIPKLQERKKNEAINRNNIVENGMAPGFKGTVEEFQNIVDSWANNPRYASTKQGRANTWGWLLDTWKRKGYLVKGYLDKKTNAWTVASAVKLDENLERPVYKKIEQHYIDKMAYGNLSEDKKEYLKEKGISSTEYNQMTQLEKEVLFRCMY